MPWRRFVAIGDSLTEGVGDPLGRGLLRGWAARLAEGLAQAQDGFEYVNLARRSLLTRDVREHQLPRALELEPDLAGALVGMNDLTRVDFHPDAFRRELEGVVGPLSAVGATVLTATFPDVSRFLPARKERRRSLHDRLAAAGEVVRTVSTNYHTVLFDIWNLPEAQPRNIISIDRMHPNDRGHALLARAFAELLSSRSGIPIDLPEPSQGRILSRSTLLHLRWLAGKALAGRVGVSKRPLP